MQVPSQKMKRSCICVLGVWSLRLSTIVLLDFRIDPTKCYFCFSSHNETTCTELAQ